MKENLMGAIDVRGLIDYKTVNLYHKKKAVRKVREGGGRGGGWGEQGSP